MQLITALWDWIQIQLGLKAPPVTDLRISHD
jgi:hypothetical protein